MRIKTQLIVTALLLVTTFFLFEFTNLDIFIQDYFYDNVTNQWLLTHVKNSWMDIVFYSGIKIAIIIFGVTVLFLYIYSFKRSATILKEYRKGLLVVWLSIVIIPVIIGSLKATTNKPFLYSFKIVAERLKEYIYKNKTVTPNIMIAIFIPE